MKTVSYTFEFSSTTDNAPDNCIVFNGVFRVDGKIFHWRAPIHAARLRKVVCGRALEPKEFQLVSANDGKVLKEGKRLRLVFRQLATLLIRSYWNHSRVFAETPLQQRGPLSFSLSAVAKGTGRFDSQEAQDMQAALKSYERRVKAIDA